MTNTWEERLSEEMEKGNMNDFDGIDRFIREERKRWVEEECQLDQEGRLKVVCPDCKKESLS